MRRTTSMKSANQPFAYRPSKLMWNAVAGRICQMDEHYRSPLVYVNWWHCLCKNPHTLFMNHKSKWQMTLDTHKTKIKVQAALQSEFVLLLIKISRLSLIFQQFLTLDCKGMQYYSFFSSLWFVIAFGRKSICLLPTQYIRVASYLQRSISFQMLTAEGKVSRCGGSLRGEKPGTELHALWITKTR